MMTNRYVTRDELNGSLVRIEHHVDTMSCEVAGLRTDVQLILQRLDFQQAQCNDCVNTMEVVTGRVNKLDSWRVTGRRLWIGLVGLIGVAATVIGILVAVGVI